MKPSPLTIGQLSAEAGAKIPTIRYYEQIGLLPEPARTASDRRVYGEEAVRRLRFIRQARQFGFEIADIRALLTLADDPNLPCAQANRIAERQLEAVEAKLESLKALQAELARMQSNCSGGLVSDCRVIEALSASHAT